MAFAKPTMELLRWHDYELGLFFHYDMPVFNQDYVSPAPLPDIATWNPKKLNTDQWLETAAAAGARYALLTSKHVTGFCLWPTKQYDYHVGNTPSGRDIVAEFFASCKKYNIDAGLYYILRSRYLEDLYTGPDRALGRPQMNAVMLAQLEEIITTYHPVELWIDGGVRRPEKGGPDVAGLINRLDPDLICFGGCPGLKNVLRWSGSEQGVARQECWSTAHFLYESDRDNVTCDAPGDPDDTEWTPVEVDMPIRDILNEEGHHCWFFADDRAHTTYSGEYLFSRYLTSVGRNANLLIGALPDRDGLISQDQVKSFRELGSLLRENFGSPLAETLEQNGDVMEIRFDEVVDVEWVEIMEDQHEGQHILAWAVEVNWPKSWNEQFGYETWFPIAEGQSIGHKRIVQLNMMRCKEGIRVRIKESRKGVRPKLKSFRVFGKRVY
jgi:alpha-L-fucosidase